MITKKQAERNIKLYYWFALFKESLFWGAILILFIQTVSGMSGIEIYYMEAACLVVSIVLNIPTGALADLLGRKRMINISSTIVVGMIIVFAFADSRLMIWAANILAFAGMAFISGADSALLYDSLKFLGREDEHHRIISRAAAYRFYLAAAGAVAAGYMAEISLRLPMYASIPPFVLCLIISLFFTEPPLAKHAKYDWRKHWRLIRRSLVFVANHRKIKWVIALIALVAVVSKLWFLSYNMYFVLVGLKLSDFGWIFAALNLVAAFSSHLSHYFRTLLKNQGSIILIILCLAIPLMLMGGIVCQLCALLVLTQNFARGYFNPFIDDFLQYYLDSHNRATVTSIKGTVSDVMQFVGLVSFGTLIGLFTLPIGLMALGIFALIIGTVLLFAYRRIFLS